jgi:hypothetical protein
MYSIQTKSLRRNISYPAKYAWAYSIEPEEKSYGKNHFMRTVLELHIGLESLAKKKPDECTNADFILWMGQFKEEAVIIISGHITKKAVLYLEHWIKSYRLDLKKDKTQILNSKAHPLLGMSQGVVHFVHK